MPQEVEAALAAPRLALADCRAGFASLLAYYGENPAAAPRDTEFWADSLSAFVRALSDAQRLAVRQRQVRCCCMIQTRYSRLVSGCNTA